MQRALAFGLILLASFGSLALAPQAPRAEALFNGKDLSGWVAVNCAPSTFTVKDGEIRCTGKPTGVLRTAERFRNFVMEMEWMHEVQGGNAGLFIWSDPLPARGQPFTRSIEVQVMLTDDAKDQEGRLLYTGHGDIFSIHGATMVPDRPHPAGWARCLPSERRTKPAGQWNHYRVTGKDGTLKLEVNGREVSGGRDMSPREGFICLESEGSPIRLRNISITRLPDGGSPLPAEQQCAPDEGFRPIFDGTLDGWHETRGHYGHWKPADWRLSYDGRGDSLWTDLDYADFELICDWRWTGGATKAKVPVIRPDGTTPAGPDGRPLTVEIDDFGDSGILLRGNDKSQVNIWCWPVGSGEVYGYRNDISQPAAVRAAVTPREKADAAPGQWNRFRIRMQGDRLTVNLNGRTVIENAQLPGVPRRGPIGLQHHGTPIEFANLYVRALTPDAK
jgi:hypothetical protein